MQGFISGFGETGSFWGWVGDITHVELGVALGLLGELLLGVVVGEAAEGGREGAAGDEGGHCCGVARAFGGGIGCGCQR